MKVIQIQRLILITLGVIFTRQRKVAGGCNGTAPQILNSTFVKAILSPGFVANNYGYMQHCQWLIWAPLGYRIHVQFTAFRLQDCQNCSCDNVTIYDGAYLQQPLLGQYCGYDLPPPISSSGNQVLVTFQSDGFDSDGRFRLEYSSHMQPTTITCQRKNYIFVGDSYPRKIVATIAPNSMCTWKITTGSGFSLETEFYSYSLCGNTPMGCDFCGYVKIWDGRRPDLRLIGTYCTNQRKNPVRSTGKYMFVEFYGHRDMTTFEASIMSRKGTSRKVIWWPVIPAMIILVAVIIIIRYYCRRQRSSRQSRSSRADEGLRQPVPHRIESSSLFTVQLPPAYTSPLSNTENAPPSYDESCSTASSALPPPSNMEDAPPSYDDTWTTPTTSALPPSARTPQTSQPQANEILLVSLPPSHEVTSVHHTYV